MFKSKGLIMLVLVLVSVIMAANINDASESNPFRSVLSKLDEIISMLEECCEPIEPIETVGVPKTGITISYVTGDDGDIQAGVEWPQPRFTDNFDGTVTDNLTQLIWLKNANCFGLRDWSMAITDCNTLNSGECGLSDGSFEGDWRSPNIKEFQSLFHYGFAQPSLPNTGGTSKWSEGDPFNSVKTDKDYWTSNTHIGSSGSAKHVGMFQGSCGGNALKTQLLNVWPVRGGN